jgi:hypothetical protein
VILFEQLNIINKTGKPHFVPLLLSYSAKGGKLGLLSTI